MKIYLVASGDSRPSANRNCWAAQKAMEDQLIKAAQLIGHKIQRAHPYDTEKEHGFIDSQKMGLEVFATIPADAPVIIAESVWQYSYHIYPGLLTHTGPILTLANWSGTWPGLVGLLNLNGCLTKAGIDFSTLWSEEFESISFLNKLGEWVDRGSIKHDLSHVQDLSEDSLPETAIETARKLASELQKNKVILGVFDEGCMGMYNAIIPDELLFKIGIFKERLSQSALLYEMSQTSDEEAEEIYQWIINRGMTFNFGSKPETELTKEQVLNQCKMYIAACRMGDHFGCDAIGIQYQQGLKDMCCSSDLAEGLLNNADRPPVKNDLGKVIKENQPFTHFNEVDECAGLDAILTQRIHEALNQPVENTLHDIRWGDNDRSGTTDDYVWVFEISGAAPAAHHIDGYAGSIGERQPAMYFPKGGSSLKGVAKPGEIVWSRIYVDTSGLNMDIGRGSAIELPKEESERRSKETTYEWPIMHAVLHGVSRDQMMAKHQSNHIQVVYAKNSQDADLSLFTKAALANELGIKVRICGDVKEAINSEAESLETCASS